MLCAALGLYAVSCAPGALWQDSGLIQYRIWHNDIEGFSGLALSHPLFYIVAIVVKYLPLGEFGHRVNLVSSAAAAVTVANLFLLIRLWLGKNLPAVMAAITLALSHTFWQHASIIETYTLWSALFSAELIMLLQYTRTSRVTYLYWLGLLNGLAIAVHILSVIPLFCYAVFLVVLLVKKKICRRDFAFIIMLWITGALPYEFLIARQIIRTGDIAGTFASAAFGTRWQGAVLNTSLSLKIAKENVLFVLLNFPTPNILLFFAGLAFLSKTTLSAALKNILSALTVLFFIFAFRYAVEDRYAFFIPFYFLVSVFIGLGAYLLQSRINNKAPLYLVLIFSSLPLFVYSVAPMLAEKTQFNLGTRGDIPYRNDYEYFLQPWKTGYRGAEQFASQALEAVEADSIIYADTTTVGPLLYIQEVKGKRPDVKVISPVVQSKESPIFNQDSIGQLLKQRNLYVVSSKPGYCPAFIRNNYTLIQAGLLWRVLQVISKTPSKTGG